MKSAALEIPLCSNYNCSDETQNVGLALMPRMWRGVCVIQYNYTHFECGA